MTGPRYSTISHRIFAGLADTIMLVPLSMLADWATKGDAVAWASLGVLLNVAWCAYSVIMNVRFGGTLGKLICGVRILDVGEQRNMTWRQALIRESVWVALNVLGSAALICKAATGQDVHSFDIWDRISMVGCVGWSVAEIVTALFSPKRRAIHDWMAGSVVVRHGLDRAGNAPVG